MSELKEQKAARKRVEKYVGDDPGKRWVTMSNALTRAAHGLNLGEKRLVAMAVSKLDSARLATNPHPTTKITAKEYAEMFDVSMDTAYDQLKTASEQLEHRRLVFYTAAKKRGNKPIAEVKSSMAWVGRADYCKGEGWIELHWWHQIVPHLFGLRRQFTTYQLEQASALRSTYSWRLLELLMRFKDSGGRGWAQYDIDDFTTSMDCTPKMSKDFGTIRRRVIEPAVKELTEKDGWMIEWEPLKGGRKVKAVRFKFARDPQGRLAL